MNKMYIYKTCEQKQKFKNMVRQFLGIRNYFIYLFIDEKDY